MLKPGGKLVLDEPVNGEKQKCCYVINYFIHLDGRDVIEVSRRKCQIMCIILLEVEFSESGEILDPSKIKSP